MSLLNCLVTFVGCLLTTRCLTFPFFFRRLHLHKKRSEVKQPFAQLAGVSLLKPLKGVDPNLMSNLETFFTLDYPKVTLRCHETEPPSARSRDCRRRLIGFSREVTGVSLSFAVRDPAVRPGPRRSGH